MKNFITYIILVMLSSFGAMNAQKGNKAVTLNLSFVVEDTEGNPISNAKVFANKGKYELVSLEDGTLNIAEVPNNTFVLIQAKGYEDLVWNLAKDPKRTQLIMQKSKTGQSQEDLYRPIGISTNKRHTVGAISTAQGEDFESYPTLAFTNSLQGRLLGLNTTMELGAMSENVTSFNIRGLSRPSGNSPIVIIDGMERPMNDLIAEEIESIQVLKDATAKILYGPRAANGVIAITTKRGEAHKRITKVSVEEYIGVTTRMPEYLEASEYAALYNTALTNDGLAPVYSPDDISGYANSTGENDIRYPNADYYNFFLRSITNNTKVSTQFLGGNEKTRYSVILGLNSGKGLEAQDNELNFTRFNVRGNIDMKLNSILSANMGMAVRIENKKGSKLNSSELFGRLSSVRPNEYPFIIDPAYPGAPVIEDGSSVAGASLEKNANLYADAVLDGNSTNKYINNQMNLGLNGNLSSITKGLSADVYLTFDNYFSSNQKLNPTTPTYATSWQTTASGSDTCLFIPRKLAVQSSKDKFSNRSSDRSLSINGKVNYQLDFEKHSLSANLGYMFYLNENNGNSQNVVNANTYLHSHYAYNNKWIVDATIAGMRSNRFAKENQTKLYPAAGMAYIISDQNDGLGYLKTKVGFGMLGYDRSNAYPITVNRWDNTNNVVFGDGNSGKSYPVVNLITYGSPLLDWEESTELNIGIEGATFHSRLQYEANVFMENRTNIATIVNENYSLLHGNFLPTENYLEVNNKGFEMMLQWSDAIENLHYSVGTNMLYAKNIYTQKDEVFYTDEYRRTEGLPTDVIMGFVSEGLFSSATEIDNDHRQNLGTHTSIGDLNYKDLNNDLIVDELDQKAIGNSTPRFTFGVNVKLNYKGLGFYALGTGAMGYDVDLKNYYYHSGSEKYNIHAREAYNLTSNTGTLPRLTTTGRAANSKTSDFWLYKGDYFRLKNVELSYTLRNPSASALINKTKFFVRGTNLFVLSDIKDVDPEVPMAGISNYPVLSTYSAGLSINF